VAEDLDLMTGNTPAVMRARAVGGFAAVFPTQEVRRCCGCSYIRILACVASDAETTASTVPIGYAADTESESQSTYDLI